MEMVRSQPTQPYPYFTPPPRPPRQIRLPPTWRTWRASQTPKPRSSLLERVIDDPPSHLAPGALLVVVEGVQDDGDTK